MILMMLWPARARRAFAASTPHVAAGSHAGPHYRPEAASPRHGQAEEPGMRTRQPPHFGRAARASRYSIDDFLKMPQRSISETDF